MGEDERVGPHLFRFEPPDTVFFRVHGELEEAHVRTFIDRMNWCATKSDYLLLLVDFTHVRLVTGGARKAGAGKKGYTPRGVAIFGASAALRIIANFVVTASNLMNKVTDNPVRFAVSEAEARAWLDLRRRIVLQERAAACERR
jgi:hypothetical protein